MVRYQGVDWRDKANWDCNARWGACACARGACFGRGNDAGGGRRCICASRLAQLSARARADRRPRCWLAPPNRCRLTATSEFSMDGVSVDPLEVMFVKVKSYMLTSEWSFSKKAAKYQEWQRQQVRTRGLGGPGSGV